MKTSVNPKEPIRRGPAPDQALFLRACRRQAVERTPVWLMRQAGRYMKSYREVRARVSMLELCKRPDLAAEVTVDAVERLGVDAAILFSDLLLIVEPLGFKLEYAKGEGPRIEPPVRTAADAGRIKEVDVDSSLGFVFEAVRLIRAALPPHIPLIGFAGAPFTLAAYMIEGGGSSGFSRTKAFMYREPAAWHRLLRHISRATARYLKRQAEAGAQALQVFDSWVGCLSPADYARYVLPHTGALFQRLKGLAPLIHFGTQTGQLLELMKRAGGDVIGLDWRVDLDEAWSRLKGKAVMGNLDPMTLFAPRPEIRRQVKRILDQARGRPGHIFNLGHGVLPETPEENVRYLVETVRELSA